MPTYQFPLEEQDKYPARITFQTLKPQSYGFSVNSVADAQNPNSIDNEAQSDSNGNFFSNLGDIASQLWNSDIIKNVPQFGRSVELYMPAGVQIQDGVVFDNADFGITGNTAFEGAGSARDVISRLNPAMEITNLTEKIKNAANKNDAANAAAAFAASKAGSTRGAIVSSALQTTINPNTRAVFKTVPLREFSFAFKLLPQSQQEAREIVDIVNMFREEIYPEVYKVGNTPISYKFPNQFMITLDYDGKDVDIMILPSYLINMNTTYNGSSASFYRDGKFSEIDLTLSFRESRTLSRQDITNGITAFGESKDDRTDFERLIDFIEGYYR